MSELSKDELLDHLESWKTYVGVSGQEDEEEAYKQLVALIKKEVTEEWIEEKARKLQEISADLFRRKGTMNYPLNRCKDFIRSLVGGICGRK